MDWLDDTLVVTPTTLQIIGTLLIPGLVAALAKSKAVAWVKSLLNMILAAVMAVVVALQVAPEGIPYRSALGYFVTSLILSNLAYNVLWKPLGLWAAIQNVTSGFGFGGPGGNEQPFNHNIVRTPPPGGVNDTGGTLNPDANPFASLIDFARRFGAAMKEAQITPAAGAPIVSPLASAGGIPLTDQMHRDLLEQAQANGGTIHARYDRVTGTWENTHLGPDGKPY